MAEFLTIPALLVVLGVFCLAVCLSAVGYMLLLVHQRLEACEQCLDDHLRTFAILCDHLLADAPPGPEKRRD